MPLTVKLHSTCALVLFSQFSAAVVHHKTNDGVPVLHAISQSWQGLACTHSGIKPHAYFIVLWGLNFGKKLC